MAWHAILILLVGLNAVAIGAVGHRLAALAVADERSARWAAGLCAGLWLALPWALGATAWPTPAVGQLATTCFCGVALVTLSERPIRTRVLAGAGLFLLGELVNELFWCAFIPLLMIRAAVDHVRHGAIRWRELASMSGAFLVVQVVPLAINRLLAVAGIGINRSFNPNWLDTTLLSLRLLPGEVDRAVVHPPLFWGALALLAAAILSGVLLHRSRLLIVAIVAAVVSGIVGSVILFAFAGYRLESIGVFSRTMITASVWFSLLPGLALAAAGPLGRWGRGAVVLVCCALIGLLGFSTTERLREWAAAWTREQADLAAFPGDRIAATASPDAFIVGYFPHRQTAVEGLEAFWDMTGALMTRFPALRERLAPQQVRYFATAARADLHRLSWDGHALTMSWCPPAKGELWSLPAPSELYVWDAAAGRLHRYTQNVTFGCGVPPPDILPPQSGR